MTVHMIAGALLILAATGVLGVGVYTIRAGRVRGPRRLLGAWRNVPARQTGVGIVHVSVSLSLLGVSELTGSHVWRFVAWCSFFSFALFAAIVQLRHPGVGDYANEKGFGGLAVEPKPRSTLTNNDEGPLENKGNGNRV